MRVLLIRHAKAGDRIPGGRDLYRPLVDEGRRRAGELADLLSDRPIVAVLSSPATRCVQTVEPLAARLGLTIDEQPDLFEGSATAHVLSLLERPTITAPDASHGAGGEVVVCTHGDVIPAVIEMVAEAGATVRGRGCETGSIWLLERCGSGWERAIYFDRSRFDLPPTG